MSDGAYALVDALTCLALVALVIVRWRQGVITKRLLRSLKESEPPEK